MKTFHKLFILLLILSQQRSLFADPPAGQVVAWGSYGPDKTALESMTNIVAISAGATQILALKSDGTVLGWNSQVPVGLSNIVAISAGAVHSLALKNDGNVVGWGGGWGNTTYGETRTPTGINNLVAISAGYYNSLALRKDGTMVGWGMTRPAVELSNIVAIAACSDWGSSDMALKNDGTVLAWDNRNGRPAVVEGLSDVVAIASGARHGLMLRRDGTVYGWGFNAYGEATGVPTTTSPPATNGLVEINGLLLNNVKAVAAGSDFSLALKNDGSVVLWGHSPYHRMDVPEGMSNVVAIAAGRSFCLAITTNSAVTRFR
jgi:alpha-tubulin suppressor-like RCC1 family protein